MKKVMIIVICFFLLSFIKVKALSPTIYVEGEKTEIKGEIDNGRTFVSLKDLCSKLNCQFGYKDENDKEKGIITIYTSLTGQIIDEETSSTALIAIRHKINSDEYNPYIIIEYQSIKNEYELKPMKEVKSIVKGNKSQIAYIGSEGEGDLYVPIRFIANGLGRKVEWDANTGSIYISVVKPEKYEHLLVKSKFNFGDKINRALVSDEIKNGECLSLVATTNDIISNNSTLLAFVGTNLNKTETENFKISQLYTELKNKQYYGSFANICSIKNTDNQVKVVSITTPNYYPVIQIHNLKPKQIINNQDGDTTDFTDNIPKTLINVPIDSRPVTKSKFDNLVQAAGYNYLEVTAGVTDKVNNNETNNWTFGNSQATRNQTRQLVSSNNNKDTSVIINMSSYMFGGLGAIRVPKLYNDFSALNELTNLVTTYKEPTYYVAIAIPRVLPEERAADWSWPIKVGGLKYYLNGANNDSYKVSYPEALVEYNYLNSMNKHLNNYNSWPKEVQTFYNNFFKWYVNQGGQETTWSYQTYNSNVVKPWEYEMMYTKFYEMFSRLIDLQKKANIELVVLVEDYELPYFIATNQNKYDWIVKDVNGQPIKYSSSYNVLQKVEQVVKQSNNNKLNIIYGTDEINHLFLARDLVKNDGFKINLDVNYSYDDLKNYVGYYDKSSVKDVIKGASNFINQYGNNREKDIEMFVVRANGTSSLNNASQIVNNIYELIKKQKTTMVVDLNDDDNAKVTFGQIMFKNNAFNVPYYGGWNTVGNAVGIALSNITVYSDLKNDIAECVDSKKCTNTLTADLEKRLIAYDKMKVINVLEDIVYNGEFRKTLKTYSNNINLDKRSYLNNLIDPTKSLQIDKFNYYYDSVTYNAYNSWPRTFEVTIEPKLGPIIYK